MLPKFARDSRICLNIDVPRVTRVWMTSHTHTQRQEFMHRKVICQFAKESRPRLPRVDISAINDKQKDLSKEVILEETTLLRNPAYPLRIFASIPGRTPSLMSPQNFVYPYPPASLTSAWATKSNRAEEYPPMSASHPTASWWRSVGLLRLRRVFGTRDGSFVPSIFSTSLRKQDYII